MSASLCGLSSSEEVLRNQRGPPGLPRGTGLHGGIVGAKDDVGIQQLDQRTEVATS